MKDVRCTVSPMQSDADNLIGFSERIRKRSDERWGADNWDQVVHRADGAKPITVYTFAKGTFPEGAALVFEMHVLQDGDN